MFEIWQDQSGVIHLKGMFVAGKSREAEELLDGITESTVLDFQYLKYISSSGLGILIKVQRRLDNSGDKLKIINSSDHIRELFTVTRFDLIFDIE
jgi:anti-anti-sigma factor